MTEPADSYSDYFDDRGEPVRRGVVLTADEQTTYDQFFPEPTDQTITEESQ